MLKTIIQKFIIFTFFALYSAGSAYAAIAQSPLFLSTSVDPNVLFNMSVETPMGGAAYNDQPNATTGCTGRVDDGGTVGTCYFPTTEYLGYFNPLKCYSYSSGRFNPEVDTINNHECDGTKYSGNFMNWATMTAVDMFVWTMTGGNRVTDTTSLTVVRRTRKENNNNWFPRKLIKSTHNVSPSTVTPFNVPSVYIDNTSFGVEFGTTHGGSDLSSGEYNVQIKVCEAGRLESNCVPYSGGAYYKPEGLIQKNADRMRFAATSYSNTNGNGIDGGVLRSNMKYVGATMPDGSGGTITNPLAEILSTGIINTNANTADSAASSVSLSGVITYLNKFSDPGYKGNDPASELFYESIRYFKNLGPTAEYLSGSNGGFPVIDGSRWEDPIQYECQNNFIIGINDANPWADKRLPGTHFNSSSSWPNANITNDFGPPTTPDTDINVTTLTNTVGDLEGLTGTSQFVGCTAANCDFSNTLKTIPGLGEVMGTYPYSRKENSYYIAGLAYYANTQDIRTGATGNLGSTTNFAGKQTISTFMVDSQEYSSSPLLGQMNMLWLAGKYGGFVDDNQDDDPNNGTPGTSTAEWDVDNDGEPDNYVLATEPDKLVTALNQAFTNIDARTSSATSVATNSTRLDTNSNIFQARFNSSTWTGQLLAFGLNTDGSIGALEWDAATLIPTENSRNIFSYDSTSGSSTGIVFEYANLNAAQQLLINTDASGSADTLGSTRVDYIRGDITTEERNGGAFRDRASLLGDVINSDPWFAGNVEDFGYSQLGSTEAASYSAYLTTKLTRIPTVYFSANDAMLHAVNATSDPSAASYASRGVELFTYVPDATITSLSTLADPFYGCGSAGCIPHRYIVDGAPRGGDAYFSSSWHSVLVGTLGAGGKGLFALDVTTPSSFNQTDVLWEISNTQAPNASDLSDFAGDLGYTLPQASIVKMQDGSWAAVIANGYESANNKAVLFLIDIQTGHIIKKIDTGVGGAGAPNGLSTPIAVDEDGDKITDSIYAGDLLGNLWKFDVSSSNSNSWKVAYGTNPSPAPLFAALDGSSATQPITAKPQVGAHPNGGLMVYFGTGKYYADNDQIVGVSPQIQTFYGIRDQGAVVTSRSNLQLQEILTEQTFELTASNVIQTPSSPLPGSSTLIDLRVSSNTTVDYTLKDGWYMELNVPTASPYNGNGPEGERAVSAPLLRNGRIIFTTLIPDANPCDSGGSSWLMELDAVNGSRLDTSPFDINNNGVIDAGDLMQMFDVNGDGVIDISDEIPISGIRKDGLGIIKTPGVVICEDGTECKYSSGSSGNLDMIKESSGSPTGRQSWRQLR